jgi:hypothetical protein
MRLELTKEIERAARSISVRERGLWSKKMVNVQSLIGNLKQQHPRALAMTLECWERILKCKREYHEWIEC